MSTQYEGTNFVHGVLSRGVPLYASGADDLILGQSGFKVFYVDSTNALAADSANGGTFDQPFATIAYALTQVANGRGDYIIVAPEHAETVSAAGGLALSYSGVHLIGKGEGDDRPTITFGTTSTSDFNINAANFHMKHFKVVTAKDKMAGPFDVNSAYCKLEDIWYADGSASLHCVLADLNADYLTILGWKYEAGTGSSQRHSCIQVADASFPTLGDIDIVGNFSAGCIENSSAWNNARLFNLTLENSNTTPKPAVVVASASDGIIYDSRLKVYSGMVGVTAGSDMVCYNVEVNNADDANGVPYPAWAHLGELGWHYLPVTAYFSSATWNTVASHETHTVTGAVRVRTVPVVGTTDLTAAAATATVSFGIAGATTIFVGATSATQLDADEIWQSTTGSSNVKYLVWSSVKDYIVTGGTDIGYTIGTTALTAGQLVFHLWWAPLSNDGSVVAGAGGTL